MYFDVRDHGAKDDGKNKDTAAIQAVADAAAEQGGGTVVFPPGAYLSGTIHLRHYISIYLSPGATLVFSPSPAGAIRCSGLSMGN